MKSILIVVLGLLAYFMAVGCGSGSHISQPASAPPLPASTPSASLVDIIDPCGDAPGIVDEVLLVLADGRVLVSFSDNSNGKNTRLALLPPGRYITTDGSNCVFSVGANGSINF